MTQEDIKKSEAVAEENNEKKSADTDIQKKPSVLKRVAFAIMAGVVGMIVSRLFS